MEELNIGDRVIVKHNRHQAYLKEGVVVSKQYGYVSVELDPNKHGFRYFACSPRSYFKLIQGTNGN